ncbi:unnamed protein product, partial [Fusarium langsethiae]
RLIVVLKI